MAKTTIEWCDFTASPVRARDKATGKVFHWCAKISPGCANCWAARMAQRFGLPDYIKANRDKVEFFLDETVLQGILRRKKPTKYFIEDCSDLFGEWVSDEWLDRCFATFALCPQHVMMILTKRPERMLDYFTEQTRRQRVTKAVADFAPLLQWNKERFIGGGIYASPAGVHVGLVDGWRWPLFNVWLGVSVENQAAADARIPLLLQTPAAVRFISAEPLLGPLQLDGLAWPPVAMTRQKPDEDWSAVSVNWCIVGGESGPNARPCDVAWVRSIVQQCKSANVACFVKQLGARPVWSEEREWVEGPLSGTLLLRDRKGGDMAEFPEDLRIREFPEAK